MKATNKIRACFTVRKWWAKLLKISEDRPMMNWQSQRFWKATALTMRCGAFVPWTDTSVKCACCCGLRTHGSTLMTDQRNIERA